MKIILAFCAVLNVCLLSGQNMNIDSMEQRIATYKVQDSTRAATLLLTSNLIQGTDQKKAILYAEEGKRIAKNIGWEKGSISALIQIGTIYYYKSEYLTALDYFQKADKQNKKLKDPTISVSVYNSLANIYCDIDEFEKGIVNYQKLLTYAKKIGDKRYEALALTNIGNVYLDIEEYIKGKHYLEKALHLTDSINYIYFKPSILNNLGNTNLNLEENEKAIEYFKESIEFAKLLQDKNTHAASLLSYAKLLQGKGKYPEALQILNKALPLAEEVANAEWQNQIRELLSINYENQKDYKKALIEFKKHQVLKDSVLGGEKKAEIIKKDLQYEMDKQEAISKEVIKRKELKATYITAIGIAIILILIILGLLYKKRNEKKEADLKAEKASIELKALQSKLNPHFVGNALIAINSYVKKNDFKSASLFLTDFATLMRRVLKTAEVEFITLEEDLELTKLYLQIHNIRFNNKIQFDISVDETLETDNILFPPLLLQPLVENSIKHGIAPKKNGVGKILISIFKENNTTLVCSVEDNGAGRKKSMTDEGNGITIVKSRVEILNNKKGTTPDVKIIDKEEGVKTILKIPLKLKF